MRKETLVFSCGVCGDGVGPVDNDVGDDEDTNLPVGWLQVLVRRVVDNPDHVSMATHLDNLVQQAIAAAPPDMPAPTQADLDGLRGQLAHEARKMVMIADTPAHMVEVVEMTVCVGCCINDGALADLAGLDFEAFEEAEWDHITAPAEPEVIEPAPVIDTPAPEATA